MPKSSAPKKKYRPKGLMRDPVKFVLMGMRPAEQDAQLKMKICLHSAMANLTKGAGTRSDWEELANGLNVGLVLCEMGYGKEFVEDLVSAQASMVLLRERYKETGRFIFRAEEMRCVNSALDIHDQQIELAPLKDFERAIMAVNAALAKGNFVTVQKISGRQPLSSPQTPAV
jgi:hypothetical protein